MLYVLSIHLTTCVCSGFSFVKRSYVKPVQHVLHGYLIPSNTLGMIGLFVKLEHR